jgi:hypothetical protein
VQRWRGPVSGRVTLTNGAGMTRRLRAASRATRTVIAAVLIAGAALVASGCGSSGSSTTASAPATSSTAAATTPATETTTTTTTSTSTASAGGTTAPGTTLKPGGQATVNWMPGSASNSPTYHLEISVVSIKKGSQSEMSGVELSKTQQAQTPYYVTLQTRNLGAGDAVAEGDDPLAEFEATDDRGGPGQELTILGKFRTCESVVMPKTLAKNASYSTCDIYMVGKGGSIAQVAWTGSGGDAFSEKPIVWKAG